MFLILHFSICNLQFAISQSHSLVDKYLSPPSGNRTTMTPSFNFFATSRAPHIAAPDDWPTKSPSSRASLFAISYARWRGRAGVAWCLAKSAAVTVNRASTSDAVGARLTWWYLGGGLFA